MLNCQKRRSEAISRTCLASLPLWCFLILTAPGQTALTGGLRGTVVDDQTNASIPGAQVVLKSTIFSFQQKTQTDSEGGFAFVGLTPIEDYELSVTAENFQTWVRQAVKVSSGDTTAISVTLKLGNITEAITVTEGFSALEGRPQEISQVIDKRRLSELPANGRNLNRFALLNPRVRNTSGLGGDGFAAGRLSINGNSFRDTQHKLDGNLNADVLFNNTPLQRLSLSTVQEFKVLTNQFSADHGGTASGFLLTTTRAGTDEVHGEAIFLGRPSGIQARPPLSDQHVPNELLQFGGSVGGPLLKGKTYYFANYEHTRQNRGAFINSPTPQVFQGEFRDQLGLLRIDHRFSGTHSTTLRLNGHRDTNSNANDRISGLIQPSAGRSSRGQGMGSQITDTFLWGDLINELRLSYINSIPSRSLPLNPQVTVVRPGYSTEGDSSYSLVRAQVYQASDQLSVQKERHWVKFGGDFVRRKFFDVSVSEFGEYRFNPGPPQPGENPTQYTQRFGTARLRYGQTQWAGFLQDDWRIHPDVTLSLGLRYDYQSITDDLNNFAPRLGFAWDVGGDGDTVVRGGAGLFYDQPFMHGYLQRYLLEGLSAPTMTITIPFGAAGFPDFPNSLPAPPAGVLVAKRTLFLRGEKMLNPYTSEVSLGLQKKLAGNWVATIDGVHLLTVKQYQAFNLNAPSPFSRTAPGQMRTVAEADVTRPFSVFGGVPVRDVLLAANSGTAVYDALDLGISRRFSGRYQFEAHYVYSSAINSITDDHHGSNPNEWNDVVRAERARSDFHQRHRFVAHGTAVLPWNAQLSMVATLASGLPVNPLTGVDNNGDTTNFDRPVGFSRNTFQAPGQTSLDVSLAKSLTVKDTSRLEFRVEVFNLFNGSNYYQLNNIYGNGAVARSTFLQPLAGVSNVDPGRQFQIAVRWLF
jgi:hypothetical protein